MGIIRLFEYLGTFMFAFSGAAVACEEKLDYFGVLFLAAVAAMGGGIIRDAVLNNGTPYAFKEYMPYLFIFIAALTVIKFKNKIHNNIFLAAFDAAGLAAFTVSSGINAINNNGSLLAVIFCGLAPAVGGGILRDIIVNRKPYVLRKEIYAAISISGSAYMYIFQNTISSEVLIVSAFTIIFTVRIICIFKNINFPIAEKI